MQKDQCFKQIKKCINESTVNLYIQQMLADNKYHIGFFYFCLMMIAYRCGYKFMDYTDNDHNIACRGLLNLGLLEQDYYCGDEFFRTHMCHFSNLGDLYFKTLSLDKFFKQHINKMDIRMFRHLRPEQFEYDIVQYLTPEQSKYDTIRFFIESRLTSDLHNLYYYVLNHTNLLNRNHLIRFLIQHHVPFNKISFYFLKYILCVRYQDSTSVDPLLIMENFI